MWSVGLLIGLIGGAGATVVAQRFFIKSKSQEIIKRNLNQIMKRKLLLLRFVNRN